jgi:hypothetical protein
LRNENNFLPRTTVEKEKMASEGAGRDELPQGVALDASTSGTTFL